MTRSCDVFSRSSLRRSTEIVSRKWSVGLLRGPKGKTRVSEGRVAQGPLPRSGKRVTYLEYCSTG